jgi:hypothetical protein
MENHARFSMLEGEVPLAGETDVCGCGRRRIYETWRTILRSGSVCAWGGLWVCGNLYHHSLEMFLKAGLSRRYSLEELKKNFHHKLVLVTIWTTFKGDFPSAALSEFDKIIADLAKFEDIRYPDTVLTRGAQIIIDYKSALTPKPQSSTPRRPEPEYKVDFYEMDRLVGAIFGVSSLNPLFFTFGLKPDVQEMLGRDNPVAAQLLRTP